MQNPNEEMVIREIRIPKWVDDYYTNQAHTWRKTPEKMIAEELTDRAQFSIHAQTHSRHRSGI